MQTCTPGEGCVPESLIAAPPRFVGLEPQPSPPHSLPSPRLTVCLPVKEMSRDRLREARVRPSPRLGSLSCTRPGSHTRASPPPPPFPQTLTPVLSCVTRRAATAGLRQQPGVRPAPGRLQQQRRRRLPAAAGLRVRRHRLVSPPHGAQFADRACPHALCRATADTACPSSSSSTLLRRNNSTLHPRPLSSSSSSTTPLRPSAQPGMAIRTPCSP